MAETGRIGRHRQRLATVAKCRQALPERTITFNFSIFCPNTCAHGAQSRWLRKSHCRRASIPLVAVLAKPHHGLTASRRREVPVTASAFSFPDWICGNSTDLPVTVVWTGLRRSLSPSGRLRGNLMTHSGGAPAQIGSADQCLGEEPARLFGDGRLRPRWSRRVVPE
jgi:hypothetical protein